jgi:hypothetical protein
MEVCVQKNVPKKFTGWKKVLKNAPQLISSALDGEAMRQKNYSHIYAAL